MNELLQAAGYAALIYMLFNFAISFGSGRPLTDAINPNRRFLPLAAVGLFGSAYTLLLQATATDPDHRSQAELALALVRSEAAKPQVVGAAACVVLGLSLLLLWVWCYWRLPRDPRTFSQNPKDMLAEYRRALAHYVKWEGGLDFAMLCEVRDGVHTVLAEGTADKDIARGVARLPMYGSGVIHTDPVKMAAEQKDRWRGESRKLFDQLPTLEEVVLPVRQGKAVGLCYDVRYGAMYVEVLDRPDETGSVWLYLFAASLNQHEVGNLTAAKHFAGLTQAVRHIRGGLSKG